MEGDVWGERTVISLCACVVCTHVRIGGVHVCVKAGVSVLCLLQSLATYFLRKDLSLTLELTDQAGGWPVDLRDPPDTAASVLCLQMHTTLASFSMGAVDLNTGPHTDAARMLPTEPPPQLSVVE